MSEVSFCIGEEDQAPRRSRREHGAITVEDPDHWRVVLMPQPLA